MNIEDIREYCLSKPHTSEGFPFDEHTLVIKVGSKVFFISGLDNEMLAFNVKCDPEKAIELREEFTSILPGYHMNKKHWNTIEVIGELGDQQIYDQIDHSYDMVVKKMTKKERVELGLD